GTRKWNPIERRGINGVDRDDRLDLSRHPLPAHARVVTAIEARIGSRVDRQRISWIDRHVLDRIQGLRITEGTRKPRPSVSAVARAFDEGWSGPGHEGPVNCSWIVRIEGHAEGAVDVWKGDDRPGRSAVL